jgi:hypothetical protein
VKKKRSSYHHEKRPTHLSLPLQSVMVAPLTLGRINGSLYDAVGHPEPDNGQGIPQPAMENDMARIPNPFKRKR